MMKTTMTNVMKLAGLAMAFAIFAGCASQGVTFQPQALRVTGNDSAPEQMVDASSVRVEVIAVRADGGERPTGVAWTWDNLEVGSETAEKTGGWSSGGKSTVRFTPSKLDRLDVLTTATTETVDEGGTRQTMTRRSRVSLGVDNSGNLTLLNANDPAGQVALPEETVLKMRGQGDLFNWEQDVLILYDKSE